MIKQHLIFKIKIKFNKLLFIYLIYIYLIKYYYFLLIFCI